MKKRKVLPSLEVLDRDLCYNPDTGIVTWKVDKLRAKTGQEAGTLIVRGYRVITIDSEKYYTHRIAWKLHHREEPPDYLDHRDRVKDHNWIKNLRPTTSSGNNLNNRMRSNNTSGTVGVRKRRRDGKWCAWIMHEGITVKLGIFKKKKNAIKARQEAEKTFLKIELKRAE